MKRREEQNHTPTKSAALIRRFREDAVFRTRTTLYPGLCFNFLFFALDLISGIRFRSLWYFALSVYYLLLAVLRLSILAANRAHPVGTDIAAEFRRYRACGIVLLPMNMILSVVIALSIGYGNIFFYPGILIYAKAVYAFYAFIMGIRNIFAYRRHGNPLLSAAKAVSLASALVSMLSLEIALTARFGADAPHFRATMTGILGAVISAVILGMAVYMIVRATKALRRA